MLPYNKMGFGTSHGEDKTVYVCGQTCREIGANMIEEINFVGFWVGCWVFLLTLVLAVNFKKFIRQGSILCLPSVRGFLKRGKSDTNAKLIDL